MSHHHTPQPDPAPHTSRTRVAIYLVDTGLTTAMRTCANAHPTWQHTDRTYHDLNPGPLAARPELRHALTDARAGTFDLLLVHSMSRISRSLDELTAILAELDDAGVVLHSATEPQFDTTTATGRMIIRLLIAFARYKRERRQQVRRRAVRRCRPPPHPNVASVARGFGPQTRPGHR